MDHQNNDVLKSAGQFQLPNELIKYKNKMLKWEAAKSKI